MKHTNKILIIIKVSFFISKAIFLFTYKHDQGYSPYL